MKQTVSGGSAAVVNTGAGGGVHTLVLTHKLEELDFAAYRQEAECTFDGRIDLASPGLTIAW